MNTIDTTRPTTIDLQSLKESLSEHWDVPDDILEAAQAYLEGHERVLPDMEPGSALNIFCGTDGSYSAEYLQNAGQWNHKASLAVGPTLRLAALNAIEKIKAGG